MAFVLRRPLRLTSAVSIASKATFKSAPTRAFHNKSANSFFTCRTTVTTPIRSLAKVRNSFQRTYASEPAAQTANQNANLIQKLLVGGAMFGGTILVCNLVFNRETREDGGMPPYERAYLNETFMHTGLGIGIIGIAARAMYQSGFVYRIMATNPWIVMLGGLGLSIGTMFGTRATDPSK
jgi:growth hormone-inducible transmembrane protein